MVLAEKAVFGEDGGVNLVTKRMVLLEVVQSGAIDDRVAQALIEAAQTIGSDGDRAQVLGAVLHKDGLGKEAAIRLLRAVAAIQSDDQKARLLMELPESFLRDKTVAVAYTEAAHSIRSG